VLITGVKALKSSLPRVSPKPRLVLASLIIGGNTARGGEDLFLTERRRLLLLWWWWWLSFFLRIWTLGNPGWSQGRGSSDSSTDWVGEDPGGHASMIRVHTSAGTLAGTKTAARIPLPIPGSCTPGFAPLMVVVRLGMLPRPWLLPADCGLGEDAVRGRTRSSSGIGLVLVCMEVRGEVDKANLDMLRGRLGRVGVRKHGKFGKGFVHGLYICRIKGNGLGVVGFGGLSRVLIGVER
jgi:hypothetical protein